MSARRKFWISAISVRKLFFYCALFLIATVIFLFYPEIVIGTQIKDVVISEIAWMGTTSSPNDEWIELYNNTNEAISLEGWRLEAEDGTPAITFASSDAIPAQGYFLLERTDDDSVPDILADKIYAGALENSGEHLFLYKDSQVIDEVATWYAGNNETKQTMARVDFQLSGNQADNWEDGSIGGTPQNSSSVSSTPTSTPTPSPTPTPSTAIYKINEVKDEDGNVLSRVKVYVDGIYLHHYAPETLTFCDGCQCDTYVNCGFGEHIIKLEKSGFGDWSEARTISAGDAYEVNPVMSSSDSTLPTISASSITPSPTPSPSLRAVGLTATLAGEILGEESSPRGIYLLESPSPPPEVLGEKTQKSQILPKIFLVSGLVFLFAGAFSLWYNFGRNEES